jgi:hypothetical protein
MEDYEMNPFLTSQSGQCGPDRDSNTSSDKAKLKNILKQ